MLLAHAPFLPQFKEAIAEVKSMRLIVNADDFGYSPGQNYGVIDAFQRGIVRSAVADGPGIAAGQAAELARANPGLGVGVHLVLDFAPSRFPLPGTSPPWWTMKGSSCAST